MDSRTIALIGMEAYQKLKEKKVMIFGAGGVGGYVIESLARSGIGGMTIVDFDKITISNLNRQIISLQSTLGRDKAEVAAMRIKDINPDIKVKYEVKRVEEESMGSFSLEEYDYVIDAIDDVKGKLAIIQTAKTAGIPVISCMGTGNKLNPMQLRVADIGETEICPLARVVRKELRKAGIQDGVKVVYSAEIPIESELQEEGRKVPASMVFVPGTAGLLIGSIVAWDLMNMHQIKDE